MRYRKHAIANGVGAYWHLTGAGERAPIAHTLAVDRYPAVQSRFVHIDPDRVVCMSWQHNNSATAATTRLLVGNRLPLPNDAQPVRLAAADGGGPGPGQRYLRPGTGKYVRASGAEPNSRASGQLFYINDLGVRFHVRDETAADGARESSE